MLAPDDKNTVLSEVGKDGRQARAYSAYGYSADDASARSGLGYNGELRDSATGYYFLGKGYRVFSPVMMRFYSPDSWSPFGEGGVNVYAYVSGNPVKYGDPTGHSPLSRALILLMNFGDDVAASSSSFRTRQWVSKTVSGVGDPTQVTDNLADLAISGRSRTTVRQGAARGRNRTPSPDYSPSPERAVPTSSLSKSVPDPQIAAKQIKQKSRASELIKGRFEENRRNFPDMFQKVQAQYQPGVVVSKKLENGLERFNLERVVGVDEYFGVERRATALRTPKRVVVGGSRDKWTY